MSQPSVHLNTIVACLLTVAAAVASPAAQTGQGMVTGLVTDAITGAPIAGALVSVSPGGITAVTDGAGVYQATVPAGVLLLMVSAKNRPIQSVFGIVVRNGATTTVNFTLANPAATGGTGVLTGHVRNAATNPPIGIANAIVSVSPGGNSTATDANGRYELSLPAGTYTVNVSAVFYGAASVPSVVVSSQKVTTRDLQLSPSERAVVEVLHIFASTADGDAPGTLIQATDGDFYGTTNRGGDLGYGTIFKMTPAGTFTALHEFAGGVDGAFPSGWPLIQATDGDFYGTTVTGGVSDFGTIFKVTSAGDVTILHAFAGDVDGEYPRGLIQGTDGDFYGTTSSGGMSDRGTVFKMTPAGIVTVLHEFSGGADGAYPSYPGGLIQATDGDFYGITNGGGDSDQGTVFKMNSAGIVTVLHSFTGGSQGANPSTLIQATDGDFYGITWAGGSSDGGTIFKMTPAGNVTVLYSFAFAEYFYTLLQATDGNFYGTTFGDPDYYGGSVFRMTPAGAFATLYSFSNGFTTDGSNPGGGLVQGTDGDFYGTTQYGGIPHQEGRGTLFRMRIPKAPVAVLTESVPNSPKNSPNVRRSEAQSLAAPIARVAVPRPGATAPAVPLSVPRDPRILAGHVLDARTNAPVSNALLTFSPGGNSVTTNRAGRYAVALPTGTYTVTVSAAQYLNSRNSGVVVGNQPTTTLDLRLSRPPVRDPVLNAFRGAPGTAARRSGFIQFANERVDVTAATSGRSWDVRTTRQPAGTASRASAAHSGAWEIEAFGGATLASQPTGGTGALPPAGASFITATGEPSRRVSSWYLADGAQLLNGVNTALGVTQQITPLDAALNASLAERPSGGGGVRVSRILTPRLTVEVTVEFSAVRGELSSDASAGIEASRASFLSAWAGLASAGQFTDTAVTSVGTVQIDNGHQIVATGAIDVALKKIGKVIPYVTVGAGVSSNSGTSVSAGLVGDYRFLVGGITPFHETDSVTVRYTAADQVAVGVLGAGFKYLVSPRVGLRVDYRAYLGPNKGSTFMDGNPVVSPLTPAGSAASATTPGIQFSNDSSIGIQSSLSGPTITDFRTFAGSGMQRHARLTIGMFWRF